MKQIISKFTNFFKKNKIVSLDNKSKELIDALLYIRKIQDDHEAVLLQLMDKQQKIEDLCHVFANAIAGLDDRIKEVEQVSGHNFEEGKKFDNRIQVLENDYNEKALKELASNAKNESKEN